MGVGFGTGLLKVGMPGAEVGLQAKDPTIAELLKPMGYVTAQIGKNHLGDRNAYLPTVHGFDLFYGNLYHLNAEEEPEDPEYPQDPAFLAKFGRLPARLGDQRSACLLSGLRGRRGSPAGRIVALIVAVGFAIGIWTHLLSRLRGLRVARPFSAGQFLGPQLLRAEP